MPISETGGLRQGNVVRVPFPYSDKLAEKRRPALIVSANELTELGFVWVVMITSTAERLPGDVAIDDLPRAGLRVPCWVRPMKIACIEPDRIEGVLGSLSAKQWNDVRDALMRLIA